MSKQSTSAVPAAPQASRRALLMGFAAAATPLAPALANALSEPAPAAADPIFAIVAEHRQAWDRYDEADKVHTELRQKADEDGLYDLPQIHLYDFPEKDVETLLRTDREFHIRYVLTGKMISVFARTPVEIEKNAPGELTESQRADWIRKKTRKLRRAEKAMSERIENSECARANDAWNAADTVLRDITARLVGTRPTTVAGAAAALSHLAEFAVDHDSQFEFDDQAAQIMANIAGALGNIIGRGQA
jgi:hypothetical protein